MFQPEQIAELEGGNPLAEHQPLVAAMTIPQAAFQVNGGGKRGTGKPAKKKNAAPANVRNWLRVDQNGETSMIQADKYKLTHKLGVQGRDLRIMDPSLATTYPSAILCREKAMVVNLEHIKVIITAQNVYVINPEDENVLPFISELKLKLSQPTLNPSASFPSALSEAGKNAMANKSNVKLEGLASLQMSFELKALEVCLDSVGSLLLCTCIHVM